MSAMPKDAPKNGGRSPPASDALAGKLAALPDLAVAELRAEWRRLYRAQPPKGVGRDLLALGVAWKLQEKVYGGLGPATKRRLAGLATTMERDGDLARARIERPRPGARLVRAWRGETHSVVVLEDGFAWRDKTWRSLSVIAREITGAHWSGPRFFGLQNKVRADTEVGEVRNGQG